ncbi:hypothetical protein C4D60_Mb04t07200 [Musa balbisiana]|uniref:SMP domain-containing protein n=1 Tax=Musa balbisiana TaxID=52838 RepID=A0A4S8KAC3_MUSBA|nr:hypothetical protein C4D60_Mb04t07200 [Musa balbisiana]
MRLPHDREATRGDAERVVRAEMRNNPELRRCPGGVADSIAAAARDYNLFVQFLSILIPILQK